MLRNFLVSAFVIGLLMTPFLIHAEVYKWIDDKGNVHFTDEYSTIPEKYIPFTEIQKLPEENTRPGVKEKPGPPLPPKSSEPLVLEAPTQRLFSGMISSVDVSSNTIVIRGEGKEMIFLATENVIIRNDFGQKLALSNLKNDMRVTVEYMKEGESNRLLSMKVIVNF